VEIHFELPRFAIEPFDLGFEVSDGNGVGGSRHGC
jgi:hypothetical protein